MPNQVYINPETPINGVHTPDEETPPTDGLFVGHRFDEQESLQVLIGYKEDDQYRIAAVLSQADTQLLVDRLGQTLQSVSAGEDPTYANPTTLHFPPPEHPAPTETPTPTRTEGAETAKIAPKNGEVGA